MLNSSNPIGYFEGSEPNIIYTLSISCNYQSVVEITATSNLSQLEKEDKNKKLKWWIILLIVLAILGAIGLVYLGY